MGSSQRSVIHIRFKRVLLCVLSAIVATALSFPLPLYAQSVSATVASASSLGSSTSEASASATASTSTPSSKSDILLSTTEPELTTSSSISVEDSAVARTTPESSSESSGTSTDSSKKTILSASDVDESEEGSSYVASEVLVVFKDSVSDAMQDKVIDEAVTVTPQNSETAVEKLSEDIKVVPVEEGASVAQAVSELSADPAVEYAQPNYIYTLMDDDDAETETSNDAALPTEDDSSQLLPQAVSINDPYTGGSNWHLGNVEAYKAWGLAKASNSVGVAVLDTGVDSDHPDLINNLASSICVTEELDQSPEDTSGHGTHVCGLVSAEANNSIGVAGISYNAEIVSVRVVKRDGKASTSSLVQGYSYVMNHADEYNIHVVNMSLGGPGSSASGDVALKNAILSSTASGILTVCASGNGTSSNPVPYECWPGNFDDAFGVDTILTVGNLTSSNQRNSYSNYGQTLDVMAPGTSIFSTVTGGSYGTKTGTSMASPIAAGCAALCFAAKPTATVDEVRSAIENTATDLGSEGKDEYYGYGKVNAYLALLVISGEAIQLSSDPKYLSTVQCSVSSELPGGGWSWSVVNDTGQATIDSSGLLTSTKAGDVTITAVAKNNPELTTSKTVAVAPAPIDAASVSALTDYTYNGSAHTQTFVVTWGGDTLVEGSDYTVSYSNNVNAGTATMTITGIGNYSGTQDKSFKIDKLDLSSANVYVSGLQPKTYSGAAQTQSPTVTVDSKTLAPDTDYKVECSNNVNAGTATCTISGMGNNCVGSTSKYFEISKLSIASSSFEFPDVVWNGGELKPAPTSANVGSIALSSEDYKLEYSDNVAVGNAKVVATGKGNFTGSATFDSAFRIVSKFLDNDEIEISGIDSKTYTGSTINQADLRVEDDSRVLTRAVNDDPNDAAAGYYVTYANNVNVGTASFQIVGINSYGGSITKEFEISARSLSGAVVSVANQTYTGSALTPVPVVEVDGVSLKSGIDYTVDYSNNVNAGNATCTVTGKGNYAGSISKIFKISARSLSGAVVSVANQTYTGSALKPAPVVTVDGKLVKAGTDYYAAYSNNVNAGNATCTVTGMGNYSGTKSAPFKISMARVTVYRLYNKVSKEHLYSTDVNEKNVLSQLKDWSYEGIGWIAPKSGTPVYRAYNPSSGEHVYTRDANEISVLTKTYGWRNEGTCFYSSTGNDVSMHRLFNPAAGIGAHHYTADANEYRVLKSIGWKDEGIAWYALSCS